ncbi:hypothetical protein D3C85_1499230 [compost metagenome]
MRVVVDPRLRIRDAHLAESLGCPVLGFLGGDATAVRGVCPDTFGNLPAHGEDRVQGRGRLLEHHGNIPATDFAKRRFADADDVVAVDHHGTGADGSFRKQAQDGFGCHGFAGTRFPYDGHYFTGSNFQADVLYSVNVPAISGEGDLEPIDG